MKGWKLRFGAPTRQRQVVNLFLCSFDKEQPYTVSSNTRQPEELEEKE